MVSVCVCVVRVWCVCGEGVVKVWCVVCGILSEFDTCMMTKWCLDGWSSAGTALATDNSA